MSRFESYASDLLTTAQLSWVNLKCGDSISTLFNHVLLCANYYFRSLSLESVLNKLDIHLKFKMSHTVHSFFLPLILGINARKPEFGQDKAFTPSRMNLVVFHLRLQWGWKRARCNGLPKSFSMTYAGRSLRICHSDQLAPHMSTHNAP